MEQLEAAFDAATQFVAASSTSGSLTDDQLLKFYGLYKQATAGQCQTPKPSFFDRRGRAKWAAWQSYSSLSSAEAQQQYVDLLTQLVPEWSGAAGTSSGSGGAKRAGAGGPVQSRMAEGAEDSEGPDASPPLLQAARAGDMAAAEQLLQEGSSADQRGGEGETALHWAADRGHVEMLRLLLVHGADVNAADCDGLTPLHYAALAEQREVAELLAGTAGVCLDARNSDGETAADVASEGWAFLQGE